MTRLVMGAYLLLAALVIAGLILVRPRFRRAVDPFGVPWGHEVG